MRNRVTERKPHICSFPCLIGRTYSSLTKKPKDNVDTALAVSRLGTVQHDVTVEIQKRLSRIEILILRHCLENLPEPDVLKIPPSLAPRFSIETNKEAIHFIFQAPEITT